MSKIEVNAIEPQCGTTLTVGAAGTTVTVPSNVVKSNALQASDAGNIISQSGTTITLGATGDSINLASGATQSGFGRTGTVDWQTGSIKTGTFTATNGEGYFVDTSGGVSTANLPAGSAGAIVSFADYTRTFQTNNLTITPNGSEKIGGVANFFLAQTEGQAVTLVYVDATEGWINTAESTGQSGAFPTFVTATGGTVTTVCTDYKVHTFTGPGTFCVSCAGNALGSSTVDYLVVAGGAGSGDYNGAGGGAGGYRESPGTASGSYTVSPLGAAPAVALPVSAIGFPVTVGAGGTAAARPGTNNGGSGGVSTFSTISSAGGGGGGGSGGCGTPSPGAAGGSGGGAGGTGAGTAGAGNTPPVSPAQGFPGGSTCTTGGAGGGGATVAGGPYAGPRNGGNGAGTAINPSPSVGTPGPSGPLRYFAGGGAGESGTGGTGGGASPSAGGTTNTGGGGANESQTGGSGIVIIRYKFQ